MCCVNVGAAVVRVVVLVVDVADVTSGNDVVVVVIFVMMFCCVVRATAVAFINMFVFGVVWCRHAI